VTRLLALLLPLALNTGGADAWLTRVRELYLSAVTDPRDIESGLSALARARDAGSSAPELLTAYEGALVTLRAKHGTWPPSRLRHLREGLALLDSAVRAAPDEAEIRYLRLLSCYFLPRILGRAGSVREDFSALARILPGARDRFPAELYVPMTSFLLQHGQLTPAERAALGSAALEP
jgi:hypothetical protein